MYAPNSKKCGLVAYTILDENMLEPGYVYFTDNVNKIVLDPSLTNPGTVGTKIMYLRATMVSYPTRYIDMPF
jgi:hypothetical protein